MSEPAPSAPAPADAAERTTYLLVDGENIDATLGAGVLAGRLTRGLTAPTEDSTPARAPSPSEATAPGQVGTGRHAIIGGLPSGATGFDPDQATGPVLPPPSSTTGSTGRTHGDKPVMIPPMRPIRTSVTPRPPADGWAHDHLRDVPRWSPNDHDTQRQPTSRSSWRPSRPGQLSVSPRSSSRSSLTRSSSALSRAPISGAGRVTCYAATLRKVTRRSLARHKPPRM